MFNWRGKLNMSDLALDVDLALIEGELAELRIALNNHITDNNDRWRRADLSWDVLNDAFDANRLDTVHHDTRIWDAIGKMRRQLDLIEQLLRKDSTT